MEAIGALFGRGDASSFAIYNLGGFYAKTGQPEPALDAVRQALVANPNLREWASNDGDLVSLHSDPEFSALLRA